MIFVVTLLIALLSTLVGEGAKALTAWMNQVQSVQVGALVMSFDFPCFKVLANNDTSSAVGHQGGIVIPKDLADYFPTLDARGTAVEPTTEEFIEVELWYAGERLSTVTTRYQHQTWGGKRSPERRLTSNLGALRDRASAGDILLFYRSLESPKMMRLELVPAKSAEFAALAASIGSRRWGVLSNVPVSNQEFLVSENEIQNSLSRPFELFENEILRKATQTLRIARNYAFRALVLKNYGEKCVITARSLISPSGNCGVDASHIVPLGRRGSNDIRNGLALSKELHWAFDLGLIAIRKQNVVVAPNVRLDPRNKYLSSFDGVPLGGLKTAVVKPSEDALEWHYENIYLGE